MMDPYQVLGVSRSASDEEIKKWIGMDVKSMWNP